jgi:hypothetical protein
MDTFDAILADETGEFVFQTPLFGAEVMGNFLAGHQTDERNQTTAFGIEFRQLPSVAVHESKPDAGRQLIDEMRVRRQTPQMHANRGAERIVISMVELFPRRDFAVDATFGQLRFEFDVLGFSIFGAFGDLFEAPIDIGRFERIAFDLEIGFRHVLAAWDSSKFGLTRLDVIRIGFQKAAVLKIAKASSISNPPSKTPLSNLKCMLNGRQKSTYRIEKSEEIHIIGEIQAKHLPLDSILFIVKSAKISPSEELETEPQVPGEPLTCHHLNG